MTFSTGLFLLVFALVRGNAEGWGSPLIVSFLAGAVVLLCAFVVAERVQERPMFDLTLLRKPAFAGASIAAFALSASMFSMFLYMTLYLQNALGYSPLQAGLRFLPVTLLSFIVAPIVGQALDPAAGAADDRRRPGVRGRRAPADGAASTRARTGRRCCPASCRPASASA